MIAYDQCIGAQLINSCQDPYVCMQISLRNYYTMVVTILCYYYPLCNILYLHHITSDISLLPSADHVPSSLHMKSAS